MEWFKAHSIGNPECDGGRVVPELAGSLSIVFNFLSNEMQLKCLIRRPRAGHSELSEHTNIFGFYLKINGIILF